MVTILVKLKASQAYQSGYEAVNRYALGSVARNNTLMHSDKIELLISSRLMLPFRIIT